MTFATLLLFVATGLGAPREIKNAAELEDAVLGARRAIRNGSFDVTCVTTSPKTKESFEIGVHCDFDFDRDESLRFEWTRIIPNVFAAGKRVAVVSNDGKSVERIVVSNKQYLNWVADEHSDGSTVAATITHRTPNDRLRIFDPRGLGLSAESFGHLQLHTSERLFFENRPDLTRIPVTAAVEDGRRVLKAEFEHDKRQIRVWVAPDEDHSVVFYEIAARYDGKNMTFTTTCKNAHFKAGNIWFPTTIENSRKSDGELLSLEQVSIKNPRFNVGVDAGLFTIRGLGLAKGTFVIDMSKGGIEREWDGAKLLRPADSNPTPEEQLEDQFADDRPLVERIEEARQEARRENLRIMLVLADPNAPATLKLHAVLSDRKNETLARAVGDYQPLWVKALSSEDVALAAKRMSLDLGKVIPPAIVILKDDGSTCGVLPLARAPAVDANSAPLQAFLVEQMLPAHDAEQSLAESLARAKREGKRVVLLETATWCGPCRMLSRFIDRHHAIFAANYVVLKVDRERDLNGDRLMNRVRGDRAGGIPWVVILDADGTELGRSESDAGKNYGFPSERPAIEHFLQVIRSTAPRMTDDQATVLRNALGTSN